MLPSRLNCRTLRIDCGRGLKRADVKVRRIVASASRWVPSRVRATYGRSVDAVGLAGPIAPTELRRRMSRRRRHLVVWMFRAPTSNCWRVPVPALPARFKVNAQEEILALRGPHADQQPGDLFRDRSRRRPSARQLGADYPFEDPEAMRWFNFYGRTLYGWRFRDA